MSPERRFCLIAILLILFGCSHQCDDKLESLGSQIVDSPDNLDLLEQFGTLSRTAYANARRVNTESAQQVVNRLKTLESRFTPRTHEASLFVADLRETTEFYQRHIDASTTSTRDIESQLNEYPNDVPAMLLYEVKIQIENDAYYEKDPELALQLLSRAKTFLSELVKRTEDAKVRETAEGLIQDIIPLREQKVGAAHAWLQVLNRDAVYPTTAERWINGDARTQETLQGKVVLFDFWALWCGPCIDAFPHLSKLHQEYANDGLVIVAITSNYGYIWDKATEGPIQQLGEVDADDERDALERYFRAQKIPFLCVVDSVDRLSQAYHVGGRPHVVLVDRTGKVRFVRTGASKETLDDIEDEIKVRLAGTDS